MTDRTLAAAIIAIAVSGAGACRAADLYAKVVGVTDGDTITVLTSNREQYKIRLAGIDAPEKGQAFGQAAKQQLSALVFNKSIKIEWSKKDRYGRIVGKVLDGSRDVSLQLIKLGCAWHFTQYQTEQTTADRLIYVEAEQSARSNKRGLWADPHPIAPWEFRKQRSSRPSRDR